jgi:GrpB-like predicted nucleotidyltransferase (UPF0157 family)
MSGFRRERTPSHRDPAVQRGVAGRVRAGGGSLERCTGRHRAADRPHRLHLRSGAAAKDIIDVQIAVSDLTDPALVPALESLGATTTDITRDHAPPGDRSDPSAWEKRYFRAPPSWRPTHLHVRETGRANARYALLFRDYLRHSPAAAAAYAEVKVALSELHPDDVDAYYAVKDPVCDLVMEAAEQWASVAAWSP